MEELKADFSILLERLAKLEDSVVAISDQLKSDSAGRRCVTETEPECLTQLPPLSEINAGAYSESWRQISRALVTVYRRSSYRQTCWLVIQEQTSRGDRPKFQVNSEVCAFPRNES